MLSFVLMRNLNGAIVPPTEITAVGNQRLKFR
jgi:hypothetical protein